MNLYSKYMESAPSFLYGLLCFSAIILWTLFAILTVPFWFLFRIFKWFQGVIISYYKLGRLLASHDVPFLHETEYNRNFINGLFVVDGNVDLDGVRRLIMARVVTNSEEPSYARMCKLVVKKYWRYVWLPLVTNKSRQVKLKVKYRDVLLTERMNLYGAVGWVSVVGKRGMHCWIAKLRKAKLTL